MSYKKELQDCSNDELEILAGRYDMPEDWRDMEFKKIRAALSAYGTVVVFPSPGDNFAPTISPVDSAADPPEQIDTIRTTTYFQDLSVPFTLTEIRDLAREMGTKVQDLRRLEEEKKAVVKQYTSRIATAIATVDELSDKLSSGAEYRSVSCLKTIDYNEGRVSVVRGDTGEEIERRAIQQHEAQVSLDLPGEEGVVETALPPEVETVNFTVWWKNVRAADKYAHEDEYSCAIGDPVVKNVDGLPEGFGELIFAGDVEEAGRHIVDYYNAIRDTGRDKERVFLTATQLFATAEGEAASDDTDSAV